jgi:chromosome segregation ATPase
VDATTIGAVLTLVGVLSASVVAYLGKKGENATTRLNSEMDQIQEERNLLRDERDGLRTQLTERDARIAERDARITELLELRLTDQVELARLRVKVVEMGGDPS